MLASRSRQTDVADCIAKTHGCGCRCCRGHTHRMRQIGQGGGRRAVHAMVTHAIVIHTVVVVVICPHQRSDVLRRVFYPSVEIEVTFDGGDGRIGAHGDAHNGGKVIEGVLTGREVKGLQFGDA